MSDQNNTLSNLQKQLGRALAHLALEEDREANQDPEARQYLLHDLNGLLLKVGAGPGAEISSRLLSDPLGLELHLRASLEGPAQRLAQDLPQEVKEFLRNP